jgi:uncharacterized cupin superfamily protein
VIEEARLEETGSGLAPAGDGWFILSLRDAAWETNDVLGDACFFEGSEPFAEIGLNLRVLRPGQTRVLYHAESSQEAFLVLRGECLLLIEDEERPLRPWDFVHCPAGTAHGFVATGEKPCVILMVGARIPETTIVFPRSELALRHGAGVETETTSPAEAQAAYPKWQLSRPTYWAELPWA